LSLVLAIAELHDGLVSAVANQPGLKVVLDFALQREARSPTV
jgi:hypothetical protein